MDKIWVKDVKEGERLKSVFLVARKAVPTSKSGKTYLSATLQDKTGELEARAFERVEELAAAFDEKEYVEVEGAVGAFQGKPQLKIESVSKLADPAAIDAAEFVFAPPPEPKKPEKPASEADDALWKELVGLIDVIADPHVKALVRAFVDDDDVAARLRRAAAAKSVHHAYAGGLLEHTVSSIKLAHRIADHYPQVDRDLLVAGAFFHDLGKVRELQGDRNAEYTDEGRLVGHLVMTAQWVHDKARRVGVSRDLEHHVVHMIIAHHGRVEYGSPKVPMTLEALLTHYIDELDSRVNSWLNLMGREGGSRRWTSADNVYEQPIWRGALPTVQAEKKGPPAELMTPVIYVPREGGAGGGQKRQKPPPKERRRPEPKPQAAGGEARPAAEGAAAGEARAAEGAAPAREARPERPERSDRPDRGGPRDHRGPGGFGDRKRGYTGPRLPGDKGPGHNRPPEKKSLTHNPFAALAQKLEDTGKPEGAAEDAAEATPPAAPVEAAPVESAPEQTPLPAEPAPAEAAAAPPEAKPSEGA